ncbi:hypothetical protein [Actinoplanes sp. HUAS TT8]|uniref:hypothetical protein n=1 Tax=Actinoplanes sp. HUAS TT8 TaxID=3447453 RepID=UPI003F524D28
MTSGRPIAAVAVTALMAFTPATCGDPDHPASPPPVADPGTAVCPVTDGAADGWAYTAKLTDGSGLVLENLRFGPRLLARRVNVAYLRIKVGDGAQQNTTLTRTAVAGAPVAVSLSGDVSCRSGDGTPGVSAIYRAQVAAAGTQPAVTVLIQQSYRFDTALDRACEPTGTAACRRFWPTTTWAIPGASPPAADVSVSLVQRFAFDPDGASDAGIAGAADLIGDVPGPNAHFATDPLKVLPLAVQDLGNGDRLRKSGSVKVLDQGKLATTWENWHQTGRAAIGMPGMVHSIAGCTECVHAHWSWFARLRQVQEAYTPKAGISPRLVPDPPLVAAANYKSCGATDCWSDGRPEIPDGSKQTACIGWTTDQIIEPVDWCADHTAHTLDGDHPPVMYWQATSRSSDQLDAGVSIGNADYAYGDSSWAPLPDPKRPHGGNGSMFFVPARTLPTVNALPATADPAVATLEQAAPVAQGSDWAVPVYIHLGNPHDQGPYYLRIKTAGGVTLRNPDPLWSASAGGAAWIRVSAPDGRPILAAHDATTLQAVPVFDRKPAAGQVSLQLDAAPDGIGGYTPSTGDWTIGNRLRDVNWLKVAGPQLNCDETRPELHSKPVEHDITRDGVPDTFLDMDCYTGDGSDTSQVLVYDGASDPAAPALLGNPAAGQGLDVGCFTFAGDAVTVHGHLHAAGDSQGDPSLIATVTSRWNGTTMTDGPAQVTRAARPGYDRLPGC